MISICGHENSDLCGEEIESAISALNNNSTPSLTIKPVLSHHSKIHKTKILMTTGCLMKVA